MDLIPSEVKPNKAGPPWVASKNGRKRKSVWVESCAEWAMQTATKEKKFVYFLNIASPFASASSGVTDALVLPQQQTCSLLGLPMHIIVNTMAGETIELHADRQERVAYLRRRLSKVLNKPLTSLALTHGDSLLNGMDLVGDALGDEDRVEISACVSQEGGPIEELMDFDDPQQLAEYMPDLYSQLKQTESKLTICPNYMTSTQTDISERMRGILVDWLAEVHYRMRNSRKETLFLVVSIVDRYLQANAVTRKRLQLVGIVSLLIASKYEDSIPIDVAFAVHVCNGAYTNTDVHVMEASILNSLSFSVCVPTVSHFADLYTKANRCDEFHRFAVQYLLELSLLKLDASSVTPSRNVAAAILLSNRLLHRDVCWSPSMTSYTGYDEETLEENVSKMRDALASAAIGQSPFIRRKYEQSQFGKVALNLHQSSI